MGYYAKVRLKVGPKKWAEPGDPVPEADSWNPRILQLHLNQNKIGMSEDSLKKPKAKAAPKPAKKAVEAEVKVEKKAEAKPEAKPEKKAESKPAAKAEPKPEPKPEFKCKVCDKVFKSEKEMKDHLKTVHNLDG